MWLICSLILLDVLCPWFLNVFGNRFDLDFGVDRAGHEWNGFPVLAWEKAAALFTSGWHVASTILAAIRAAIVRAESTDSEFRLDHCPSLRQRLVLSSSLDRCLPSFQLVLGNAHTHWPQLESHSFVKYAGVVCIFPLRHRKSFRPRNKTLWCKVALVLVDNLSFPPHQFGLPHHPRFQFKSY